MRIELRKEHTKSIVHWDGGIDESVAEIQIVETWVNPAPTWIIEAVRSYCSDSDLTLVNYVVWTANAQDDAWRSEREFHDLFVGSTGRGVPDKENRLTRWTEDRFFLHLTEPTSKNSIDALKAYIESELDDAHRKMTDLDENSPGWEYNNGRFTALQAVLEQI